ncbi:uncharacterized protein LOC115666191 [Syzygium oleosum]|uniref:uncharacterized protein LOC115666191 n=1 Tax=Syzygium oleosum TaxID=219896 RepID=UPI0024BA1F4E|nr:uncharacterized protein LOC115666191 [Syzygium oleosum]
MGIKNWREPRMEVIYLGRNSNSNSNNKPNHGQHEKMLQGWQLFWRRFKRDKRASSSLNNNKIRGSYDPDEYSQNFDQGIDCTEPENLSRSFSARYADPWSRIEPKKILLIDMD